MQICTRRRRERPETRLANRCRRSASSHGRAFKASGNGAIRNKLQLGKSDEKLFFEAKGVAGVPAMCSNGDTVKLLSVVPAGLFINITSTIEVSSTTRTSHSNGCLSFRVNLPVAGFTSSSRWIVLASMPVVSNRRFAARPVGAHNRHLTFLALKTGRIAFARVVLPTPGPPVMMSDRLVSACLSAACWLGASSLPTFCWHQTMAFPKSIGG